MLGYYESMHRHVVRSIERWEIRQTYHRPRLLKAVGSLTIALQPNLAPCASVDTSGGRLPGLSGSVYMILPSATNDRTTLLS